MVSCAERHYVCRRRLRVRDPQEYDRAADFIGADAQFVVFNRFLFPGSMEGMVFTLFAIAIAAAETAIAIAIIVNIYRAVGNTDINSVKKMKY